MHRILTDQDFDEDILHGLARIVELDWLPARAFGQEEAVDEVIVELALRESRVLLTHDARTLYPLIYRLRAEGRPIPRVAVVPQSLRLRVAIEQLQILLLAATEADWERNPFRLPL
ncbi:MAG: hypothetical protein WD557_04540 [Dehalococcoidia bacterium]